MTTGDERDSGSYTDYDWFLLRLYISGFGILLVSLPAVIYLMSSYRFWAPAIYAAVLPVFLLIMFIGISVNYLVKIQFGVTPSLPSQGWKAVYVYLNSNFSPAKRKQISVVVISVCVVGLLAGIIISRIDDIGILAFSSFLIDLGFICIYLGFLKSDIKRDR
jgi:hypothetical protein